MTIKTSPLSTGPLLIATIPGTAIIVDLFSLDASFSETRSQAIQVTKYPVSRGATVSDNATVENLMLSLEGAITESPLSALADRAFMPNRRESQLDRLYSLATGGYLFSVQTGLTIYQDMAIISISDTRTTDDGQLSMVNIEFQQVRIVQALAVAVPPLRMDASVADSAAAPTNAGPTAAASAGAAADATASGGGAASSGSSSMLHSMVEGGGDIVGAL